MTTNNSTPAAISSVKEETMPVEVVPPCGMSLRSSYDSLCLDLNMDNETSRDAWRSYEHIRKHYVLEGDQLHWLAVSLYISCRTSRCLLSSFDNNPISIDRLLRSAHCLSLVVFFDKLHKWEDMANLPETLRNQIDELEHGFNVSSIVFQKYTPMFVHIFGGNPARLQSNRYQEQRTSNQINPKLALRIRQRKCSLNDLYALGWTLFALAKTIYPATGIDLLGSFHLLIACLEFIYQNCRQTKLDDLLKGAYVTRPSMDSSGADRYPESIIEELCNVYSGVVDATRTIYEQHLRSELFDRFHWSNRFDLLNESNLTSTIREMNRLYDEIVLTRCVIDDRMFLSSGENDSLTDLVNSLNENRNRSSTANQTPLTANAHLALVPSTSEHISNPIQGLTPISQAKKLIEHLTRIVGQQQLIPSEHLRQLIPKQPFLDDLVCRLAEWEQLFYREYDSIQSVSKCRRRLSMSTDEEQQEERSEHQPSRSCRARFQMALRLFYEALEKILMIERKRLATSTQTKPKTPNQIEEAFHKLIVNNDFVKSLLALCLVLVLHAHADSLHDFQWLLEVYSLHGYTFLKIIEIFVRAVRQLSEARAFIKHLSSIEEMIIASMAWSDDSALWTEIESRGILSYDEACPAPAPSNHPKPVITPPPSTPTHLTGLFLPSPNANKVCRKLFDSQTDNSRMLITRTASDPVVERSSMAPAKLSPYTMFYRKLYQLVLARLRVLCLRLRPSSHTNLERSVWNVFLILFYKYSKNLLRCRHLDQFLLSCIFFCGTLDKDQTITWPRLMQAYKAMPGSKPNILRSVFLYRLNPDEQLPNEQQQHFETSPYLTPSKPAGTIQVIGRDVMGDIASFYQEIFLTLPDLSSTLSASPTSIDVPRSLKFVTTQNPHVSLHAGANVSIDYSSRRSHSSLFAPPVHVTKTSVPKETTSNIPLNVLSSSIQAGANNTVTTTKTRTFDGKFLTTICATNTTKNNNNPESISADEHLDKVVMSTNQSDLIFGQSSSSNIAQMNRYIESRHPTQKSNSIKRSLSGDSNTNCLTSMTKRVLQIHNDRQKMATEDNQQSFSHLFNA